MYAEEMNEKESKQFKILKQMYDFNVELMSLSEEELKIFCANNAKLIQKLKDALSY